MLVSTDGDTAELEELLYSLGYQVAHKVVQKRARPDPATFIGPGKVEEVQAWLAKHGVRVSPLGRAGETLQRAERRAVLERAGSEGQGSPAARDGAGDAQVRLVAVNAHLKPSQIAGLERLFGVDVYDRVRVILEIFQQRAHTQEARLQVELARLRYERPLVREYIHLAKRGEHPGFMAGGAYAVEQYYNTINRRLSRIQGELGRIAAEREVRRKHRRRGGFHLLSLAGYANAGKSSLLKRLSGEDVLVENRMFSTLETRTGRARAGDRDVLVTDTVGFIDGLPPDLVKAFRSTLEEIAHADVIVLVCDASDPVREIARKLRACFNVLQDSGDLAPLVLALNKMDLVPAERRIGIEEAVRGLGYVEGDAWVWVSARTGEGVGGLVERVLAHMPPLQRVRAVLPRGPEAEHVLAEIREEAQVEEVRRSEHLEVAFQAPGPVAGSLAKRIQRAGGTIAPDASAAPPP